jgi:hypothetical protein
LALGWVLLLILWLALRWVLLLLALWGVLALRWWVLLLLALWGVLALRWVLLLLAGVLLLLAKVLLLRRVLLLARVLLLRRVLLLARVLLLRRVAWILLLRRVLLITLWLAVSLRCCHRLTILHWLAVLGHGLAIRLLLVLHRSATHGVCLWLLTGLEPSHSTHRRSTRLLHNHVGAWLHVVLTLREPLTLQANTACLLAFPLDVEPLVDTGADAKSRKLELDIADIVALRHILVFDSDEKIVADVLHINGPNLIPLGSLARAVLNFGFVLLLAILKFTVGVHLAEHFGVTGQFGLDNVQAKFAGSHN